MRLPTCPSEFPRISIGFVLVTLAFSESAVGQGSVKPSTELGTLVGATILSQSGFSVTHLGFPGDGIQAAPTLYATFFPSASVMVEPQIAYSSRSNGGGTSRSIGLAFQVGYLFAPARPGSAYFAVNLAFESLSFGTGGSVSGPGYGGAVGYRVKIRDNFAVRLDARYRRWFSDFGGLNEFGLGVGLGAIL